VKLGKRSWLAVAIGVFLIASISLWIAYSQHAGERKHLQEDLASVYARLNSAQFENLADRQSELEQQLEKTIAQSEAARETLSRPMNSIIISDILFSTAEANSVNITEISSSVASSVALEGVPCLALPLTAKIEGEVNNLVAFITQLNSDLASGIVKSVNLDISQSEGNGKSAASIQMVIYKYEES
jgi:hypothetical protein